MSVVSVIFRMRITSFGFFSCVFDFHCIEPCIALADSCFLFLCFVWNVFPFVFLCVLSTFGIYNMWDWIRIVAFCVTDVKLMGYVQIV